jgi:type I restriction enzyme S subunit
MSVDTLRETFHINRITPDKIQDFLTAQTYRPEITTAKEKIKTLPWVPLQSVCKRPIRQGKSPSYAEDSGLLCIKPKNTNEMIVSLEELSYIQLASKDEVAGQRLQKGDIVITRSGSGTIGRASIFLSDKEVYTNDHLFIVRTDAVDSYCTCAFLNTYWGHRLIEAGISGSTGQLNLSNEHIKGITLYTPAELAQKYIGDKVRQAERLRAWAKALETKLDSFVQHYQPGQKTPSTLATMVSPDLLTDMLTATTYRDHYIKNQKNLRTKAKTTSIFHLLSSVTNGFDERDETVEGLPYVKVADVSAGYINLRNAPKIRVSALEEASSKQKPRLGDLLLTRKGTFGVAAVVMEPADFLCSSEVFSCKPKKAEFMPILAWFLNSSAGNMQFWQFSTGTTMPGINQENLGSILIPDFSDVDLDDFNSLYEQWHKAKKSSELLTEAAKLLVEALIEGQLTEAELIAAEQALQAGNDQLDRRVLNRLKADGIDGQGPALFGDLDELYHLLTQAEED